MFKIKNAIILAAGRGSRMKDLTNNIPKPLLKIENKPIIENIIENLQFITKDITIVVGYLHQEFDYLKSKYKNIKIVLNENWENGNNVTSIKKVLNELSNTLIINGDVIIKKNVFENKYENVCFYCENNSNIDEWLSIFDSKKNIIDFDRNSQNKTGVYQREVAIINKEMSEAIKKEIDNFDQTEYYEFLILHCSKKYNIDVKAFAIEKDTIFDLDSKEEFEQYCKGIK